MIVNISIVLCGSRYYNLGLDRKVNHFNDICYSEPIPQDVPSDVINIQSTGSVFAPVIEVIGSPDIEWIFDDGSTSSSLKPVKDYGTEGSRHNYLKVTPWSALIGINVGYDAGDGGYGGFDLVDGQNISGFNNLNLVAGSLQYLCASNNPQLQELDLRELIDLEFIELYRCYNLTTLRLDSHPVLERLCVENCDLDALNLSGCIALEDLRGALNNFSSINWGSIGQALWHICVRDNPQFTENIPELSQFPNLTELYTWNDNQIGPFECHSTVIKDIRAFDNHYTSADISGCTNLSVFYLSGSQLTLINIDGTNSLMYVKLENCGLVQSLVDYVLKILDGAGQSNGNLDLTGNAVPSAEGLDHYNNLTGKGWAVQIETDDTTPVLTIPSDYNGIKDGNCEYDALPSVTGHATATDNYDDEPTVTYSDVIEEAECLTTISRTWKAEDYFGNFVTGIQNITFTDNTEPVLILPDDYSGSKDASCLYETLPAVTGQATATDNCDNEVTITYNDVVEETEALTMITRTWRAEDNCENIVTGIQTITFIDDTEPELMIPDDYAGSKDDICSYDAIPDETGQATATDNCDAEVAISYTDAVVEKEYSTDIIRTWKAEDDSGNSITGIQNIIFTDDLDPILTLPSDYTGYYKDSISPYDTIPAVTGQATAMDNCDEEVAISYTDEIAESEYSIEITRTWMAEDKSGNNVTGTQMIKFMVDNTHGKVDPVKIMISGNLMIVFLCDDFVSYRVDLINSSGVLISRKYIETNTLEFDISGLTPGLYFLVISKGEINRVEKVFINNVGVLM